MHVLLAVHCCVNICCINARVSLKGMFVAALLAIVSVKSCLLQVLPGFATAILADPDSLARPHFTRLCGDRQLAFFYTHKSGAFKQIACEEGFEIYTNDYTGFKVGWKYNYSGTVKAASLLIRCASCFIFCSLSF